MLGGKFSMKTTVKVLTAGFFAVLLTALFAVPAAAQTCDQETKEPIYKKYIDNYNGNLEQRKVAVEAAKEYIKICTSSEIDSEIVNYLKNAVPELEKWIAGEIRRLEKVKLQQEENARFARFDKAYRATKKDWDEVFAAGADILKHKPDFLDMRILLASVSAELAEANPPVNSYNQTVLQHANDAIARIKAGEISPTEKWGGYNYEWKSKENALGWLNYTIGYIKFYPQEKRDEGIEYFYNATQYNSDTKKYAPTYTRIGDWYLSKAAKLGKEREGIDITETAGEDQQANIQKALDILGMEKGLVVRAIDAYARAYSIAKADEKATAAYKTSLYDKLKTLFAFRYPSATEAENRSEAKINSYVAGVNTNSLPDPASQVEPIVEKIEETAPSEKPVDSSTDGASTKKTTTGERSRTVNTTAVKKTDNR